MCTFSQPSLHCRAGSESDVFVTPNLNVKYEVVDIIEWNHTKCEPIRNETTNEFPSNIAFDVKAPENKPALSFYSRYHIETVKIPELQDSIASQIETIKEVQNLIDSQSGEKLCCSNGFGYCKGIEQTDENNSILEGRACEDKDMEEEKQQLKILEISVTSWNQTLINSTIVNGNSITNWFNKDKIKTERQDQFKEHSSALAPDMLIDSAVELQNASTIFNEVSDGSRNVSDISSTTRLQFSGNSGSYTYTLSDDSLQTFTRQNCAGLYPILGAGATVGVGALVGGATVGTAFGGFSGLLGAIGAGIGATVAIPLAAGASVISNAIAGCNYVLDISASAGDTKYDGALLSAYVGGKSSFGKSS